MANTNISTLTDMTTGMVIFEITPNTPITPTDNRSTSGSFVNNSSTQSISNITLTDPFNQGDRIMFAMAAHPYGPTDDTNQNHSLINPPTFGGVAMNEFITGNTTDAAAISAGFGSANSEEGRRYNGQHFGGWHNNYMGQSISLWYLKNPSMSANQSLEMRTRYYQNNNARNYGKFGFVVYTGIDQTDTFAEMTRIWDSDNNAMQVKYYKAMNSMTANNKKGGTSATDSAGWTPSTPGNLICTMIQQGSRYATGIDTSTGSFDYLLSDGTKHKFHTDFTTYYSNSYGNNTWSGNTAIGMASKLGHVSPVEYQSVAPGGTSSYVGGNGFSWQLNTSAPDPLLTVPDGYTCRIHDLYVTSIDIDGFQFDLQVSGLAATGESPATLSNSSGVSTMTIGTTNVTTLADGYIFRGKKLHLNQFADGRIKLLPDGKNIWLAAGDQLKMKMYHEDGSRDYLHYKARVNMQVEMIKST